MPEKDVIMDHIETLQENIEEVQINMKKYVEQMDAVKKGFDSRAKEKTLALYFEMIGDSLQKECGDKPYSNKMNDKSQIDQVYQSQDSLDLKQGV